MTFCLKPSEIFYSQDSINNVFDRNSQHRNIQIGETLDAICDGRTSVLSIPTISVVSVSGKWISADNRRLWVVKQLERLGKVETINVHIAGYIPSRKMTSNNGGVYIRVRGPPGGRWYLEPDKRIRTIPEEQMKHTLRKQSVSIPTDLRSSRKLAWSESDKETPYPKGNGNKTNQPSASSYVSPQTHSPLFETDTIESH
ncbi:hypothetical protein MAR_003252, partial [Mya arenaria]